MSEIYILRCKDKSVHDTYISYTNNWSKLNNKHNFISKTKYASDYDKILYKTIRKYGGYNNWYRQILRRFNHKLDDIELVKYQKLYIKKYKPSINIENEKILEDGRRKKRNEKFECECGGSYVRRCKKIHYNTMKHKEYISVNIMNNI